MIDIMQATMSRWVHRTWMVPHPADQRSGSAASTTGSGSRASRAVQCRSVLSSYYPNCVSLLISVVLSRSSLVRIIGVSHFFFFFDGRRDGTVSVFVRWAVTVS